MSNPNPPKANPTSDSAKDGQSNKNAAHNGSHTQKEPAKAWADPEQVQNDSLNTLETAIKAKLDGKPADSFDRLYEQAANEVYPIIYDRISCGSIPDDYGRFNVLKRVFFAICGMQPKRFKEWCEQVELRVPAWDMDIPEHPSHHYQAWMLREHPTEAPDLEKRYKPTKAATPPPPPRPAKPSSSKALPRRTPIHPQTQAVPRSPKGKDREVAPKPESTTTTNAKTTPPGKIDSCDRTNPFWVSNVIKSSLQDRHTHWQYGGVPDDLLAEGEGYFEVRLPHKLPAGEPHKDCFNNEAILGLEGFVHPDFRILRFQRQGEWYLMPYRSIKKQGKKEPNKGEDSKESQNARGCSKVTSEFVETYFALRGLREGIVPSDYSKCEPVELLKHYFRNLAPLMTKLLIDFEQQQISNNQAFAEQERKRALFNQRMEMSEAREKEATWVTQLQNDVEAAKDTAHGHRTGSDRLTRELETTKTRLQDAQNTSQATQTKLDEEQNKLQEANKQLKEMQSKLGEEQQKLQEATADLDQKRTRLLELEQPGRSPYNPLKRRRSRSPQRDPPTKTDWGHAPEWLLKSLNLMQPCQDAGPGFPSTENVFCEISSLLITERSHRALKEFLEYAELDEVYCFNAALDCKAGQKASSIKDEGCHVHKDSKDDYCLPVYFWLRDGKKLLTFYQ